MNLETTDDLPIQILSIHKDQKEEELPEDTDALVPPPEVLAATPMTEVLKLENITEENNGELTTNRGYREKKSMPYALGC